MLRRPCANLAIRLKIIQEKNEKIIEEIAGEKINGEKSDREGYLKEGLESVDWMSERGGESNGAASGDCVAGKNVIFEEISHRLGTRFILFLFFFPPAFRLAA